MRHDTGSVPPVRGGADVLIDVSTVQCPGRQRAARNYRDRLAPEGTSHSSVTATRVSRSPSAMTMSVALGRSEQILIVPPPRRLRAAVYQTIYFRCRCRGQWGRELGAYQPRDQRPS